MKPNPNGIEALEEMLEEVNEVFVVSTPDPNFVDQCCAEKCQWVIENLGADYPDWGLQKTKLWYKAMFS